MGTTFHKMMGYGITGLSVSAQGRIDDPRINSSSVLLSHDEDHYEPTVRDFVRSTLEDKNKLELVLKGWGYGHLNPDSTEPMDCVMQPSGTIKDTLILRPVGDKDWYRRGNLMDQYEEEAIFGGGMKPRIQFLSGGIYPFANSYFDTKTKDEVNWYHIDRWVRATNDGHPLETLDGLAQECSKSLGIEELDHAKLSKRVQISPPKPIIELANFGKLFTNPNDVYQLQPLIATWWS